MKSEKEWINNLRNRMEDYSEPLPEGLWDKLSKELEEPKTPKVIPIWRRWQAAAAVLVLLVSSLTYWFWSSPEADFRNQELAVEVKNTPLPAQTSSLDEQVAEVKHAEPFLSLSLSTFSPPLMPKSMWRLLSQPPMLLFHLVCSYLYFRLN